MTRRGLAALASLLLLLSACSTADALEGTSWVVVELGQRPSLPEVTTTAEFADGAIAGSGGCNTYEGPYRVDGDSITIGSIGSTLIGCDELFAAQEQAFFQGLSQATGYKVIVDRLELLDAEGELLVAFRRADPDRTPVNT